MARSKSVSDEEILIATINLLAEMGSSVTLAHVGDRVGLSAATVVQRFGTKRKLMLEVLRLQRRQAVESPFDHGGTAVDRLVRGMASILDWMTTPQHVANLTAVLHTDIADPEFRGIVLDGFRIRRQIIAGLIDEAIDSGEMKRCDSSMVARLLQVTVLGAQQIWAIEPEGEMTEWVEACLRNCIAPWLVADDDLVVAAV